MMASNEIDAVIIIIFFALQADAARGTGKKKR